MHTGYIFKERYCNGTEGLSAQCSKGFALNGGRDTI